MSLAADSRESGVIAQVQRALADSALAASFAPLLYARNGFDEAGAPALAWLAGNARAALDFITDKPQGTQKLSIRSAPGAAEAPGGTIIEILNDDMPFLVDSIMGELQARGLQVRWLLHPIFKTKRDRSGKLLALLGPGDQNWNDGRQESYISIQLPSLPEAQQRDLSEALSHILTNVRLAVTDWRPMLQEVEFAVRQLETTRRGVPPSELREGVAFLRWLEAGNFTFLGTRRYALSAGAGEAGEFIAVEKSGLGVLRDPHVHVLRRGAELVDMTPEIRRFYAAPAALIVTKASMKSLVHRRVHMDYVGVKTFGRDGTLAGEMRFVGLFTSQAYVKSPRDIPFLRHKVETVLKLSGYPEASHAGKSLINVIETFPRDELFQIDADQLHEWSEAIVDLEIRPRVRVFARVDRFDRFVSALVFVPRDRYTSDVRERIGDLLARAYNGRIAAFYPYFTDGPLVRVQLIVGRYQGATPDVDLAELEREVGEILRTWDDRLADALAATGPRADQLLAKYRDAFSAGYVETFTAERALQDINRIERLGPELPVAIDFYREPDWPAHCIRGAVYRYGDPISLSERVPLLENMGFTAIDERSYRVHPKVAGQQREVALHDMVLETADKAPLDLPAHERRLEAGFLSVFHGRADNDSFNRLIISAGADWRSVAALRAYAAFLRQLGSPFGLRYIADVLHRHAGVARDLIELFHLRFDPDRNLYIDARNAAEDPVRKRIEGALADVPSLDEDRILRQFLNLIATTVRTNFYQTKPDGGLPDTIAFKLDSGKVEAAPQPRPYCEIWVYSPRVEGVHLRFAPIARGGIRWSDRAQDFRTEVLGLVRAQVVKNAVIVPSGAKGGFLPKQLPRSGTREDVQKEGIAAYRSFISTLLDLTDNLKDGKIVPPVRVVRHDGDDPYLVVAADKGTATFSDIANEISAAHDFWLGDAFASGGSVGYDHKGMGITARGAWECVKRHFREMDVDIQTQPFRVTGVGDMSGDVFGNGMLLSDEIRLVAAFDHRDIFIDPDPGPDGMAERRRLFNLQRSSWQDYDKAKISKGGGVFSRASKAIPLSAEMKALLGLDAASVTPAELMRAVLKCKTDLLWFGGIGTYIRASSERDEEVGDRANDPLRITAAELNAKVIGEGANLGITQRARIEFAARGGRINTDFIDNSAGVNTSDQEVNIKIALAPAVRTGKLTDEARRKVLADMTDDVGAAALRNNYQQSLALSLAEQRSARDLPDYGLLMGTLEARGLFARTLEALPSDTELRERARAGRGLTRPELAVLLSYAKIALQHDLLQSRVPDEAHLESWLESYFPPLLREQYRPGIEGHSLRREIIALGLTNAVVNRGGPTMTARLAQETRRPASDVAQAFVAVREVFDLPALWQRIDALDGKVPGEAQLRLYEATQELVRGRTRWFLQHAGPSQDLPSAIAAHRRGLQALAGALETVLPPRRKARLDADRGRLAEGGIPRDLAAEVARLDVLAQAPAITTIALATGKSVPDTARAFLEIGERLRIADLIAKADAIRTSDQYDGLAIAQAAGRLRAAQDAFTRTALAAGGVEAWSARHRDRLEQVQATLDDIGSTASLTVSRLLVAAGQLSELAEAAPSA